MLLHWPSAYIATTALRQGKDLHRLVAEESDGGFRPSTELVAMASAMATVPRTQMARAIGSLIRKGYFSTVGAVKVEGRLPLESADGTATRECSIVDFAGQMEYLVSHQLLLASMHTLCMVIQPAPAFGQPQHRHHRSWSYWLQFLRALGDRCEGSLVLAVSQLDRMPEDEVPRAHSAAQTEFERLRLNLGLGEGLGARPVGAADWHWVDLLVAFRLSPQLPFLWPRALWLARPRWQPL